MPHDRLNLAVWRRAVAELDAAVRADAERDPQRAWERFRLERDHLFRAHPRTPLPREKLEGFDGLPYFDYDPRWRLVGRAEQTEPDSREVALSEGPTRLTRVGRVSFDSPEGEASLDLFWIEGYGGGLFLPFKDASNGRQTYGGGRYLYDTVKGADLGVDADEITLDFNLAYHPSCAYSPNWVCPLAPPGNILPFPVRVGERL